MQEDEFLTVAEVAERLKLNQQTVRNWIDAGKLGHVRVGRRVRIPRADFEALVGAGATGATTSVTINGPTAADFWSGEPVGEAIVADQPGN